MKPLSLRARSFRTFESLDVDLPTGAVAVIGDNGAGKSSLVMLADLCLFGPESRSLAPYQSEDALEDLMIELTFEHGGKTYRVRRGYCANGRGKASCDFETYTDLGPGGLETVESPSPSEATGGSLRVPGPTWSPLTCESIKATDAKIVETIGMTRETFHASAYLAQGDGSFADPSWDPRQRKELLFCSLGLDAIYGPHLERARAEKRETQAELQKLEGAVGTLEETVSEKESRQLAHMAAVSHAERCAEELALTERNADAAQAKLTDAEKDESRRRELKARVDAAEAEWKRYEDADAAAVEARTALEELRSRIAAQQQLAERVPELEQKLAERENERAAITADLRQAEAAVRERDERRRRIEQRHAEIAELGGKASAAEHAAGRVGEGEVKTCHTCGQTIADEAAEKVRQGFLEEAKDARARIAALDAENRADAEALQAASDVDEALVALQKRDAGMAGALSAINRDLRDAKIAEAQIVSMRETAERYEAQIAKVGTPDYETAKDAAWDQMMFVRDAIAALPAPTADVDLLRRDVESKANALTHARTIAQQAAAEVVRAEEALRQIAEAEAQLAAHLNSHRELHLELDLLGQLERAYGRDGIPTLIVENSAIPAIEEEANRILQELHTSYRVELRTQRELKSGDGVADTLDVVILTDVGERPYESFSGGERSRINVALRIALARLLAHRRDAESRVLLLDEVEYLDEAGLAALAEILQGLTGEFETILTVSHASALRDAFDQVIEIRKDGNRSEVVG